MGVPRMDCMGGISETLLFLELVALLRFPCGADLHAVLQYAV